jgi:nitrogen fixation protein FixH
VKRLNVALGIAVAAGLGAVGGTIWVGAHVREETVVANPYEEGLRQDVDRRARAALGLAVSLPGEPLEAGAAPLVLVLADRAGPVDGARVTVELSRPETSRDPRSAPARPAGNGRYVADLAFPAAGDWDVRFDVARGADRVRLERRVVVRPACDLSAGPCARPLEGGDEVVLDFAPRPLRAMQDLAVRVEVRATGRATPAVEGVVLSFLMPGMDMGENRVALAPVAAGAWQGKAVLVRCPSGRSDWVVQVDVAGAGAPPRTARFALTLAEGRR